MKSCETCQSCYIYNYVKNAKIAIFRCLKNQLKIEIEVQKSLHTVMCKLPDDPENLKSIP